MLIRPDISRYSVPARFAVFIGIMILCLILFSFIGLLLSIPIFQITLAKALSGEAFIPCVQNAGILKYLQLVNQLGLFVVPPLLFACFSGKTNSDFLCIRRKPSFYLILLSGLILIAGLPIIDRLLQWNELMKLPAFAKGIEQWMKDSERNAASVTELFLKTGGLKGLAANLFIMAAVPAIGEEFVFRGVLLGMLNEWTGRKIPAVIISAFVFSAIHLQFYGFLPRFVLGVYLGFLFVRSGSIWVPVFAHFVNNAITVIVAYLYFNGIMHTDYEKFGSTDSWLILAVSLMVSAILIFFFMKLPLKKEKNLPLV